MNTKGLKKTISYTIPVFAGYIFLGFAFGLLVRTKGFPVWYAVAMSVIIYSGASQYAAVPLLGQAFDPMGSFLLSLMISARHLFYGIPMLKKYSKENVGAARPVLIYTLTDETFSVVSTLNPPEGVKPKVFYSVISILDFLYWNLGTLLGAIVGNMITFNVEGLDFVLTALFIVLFLDQLKTKSGRISGFVGLITAAVALVLFGSGKMVLISMIAIMVILVTGRKVIPVE